jgi:small ligand-binding sensory domain FIST
VSVRIGCGLSTDADPRAGAVQAARQARAPLGDERVDLALVFASGHHLAAPEATLEGVCETLTPGQLVGCGAGGVLADGHEVERGTAVAVWAAALDGGGAEAFAVTAERGDDGVAIGSLPPLDGAQGVLLLPDPLAFPADLLLRTLAQRAPGVPVLGGIASARTHEGSPALFLGDAVVDAGAVGVRLSGVELLPCVSQGAAPVGPELTITAAGDGVIEQLAGRPALLALREAVEELDPDERATLDSPPLLGIGIDPGRADYAQGDFLVRTLTGADPASGSVAVGAPVAAGQVVQLHARDADSADRDLHDALALRAVALGEQPAAGALMFSCNGRGHAMFAVDDHDASTAAQELAGAPVAGFFAAGEIGPVGGASFLHGYTATLAVFAQ